MEGLAPAEYWAAWGVVEALAEGASVDLVRFETAAGALQRVVRDEGEPVG